MNHGYEIPNNVLSSVPNPKVTVRTLAYNHARYIRECIEGVLMQETSFPYEYIIAEDCSTDNTREIVLEYAEKYPDVIRVITSDENVGGTENVYRADHRARGEYIAICEGDDYWADPKKLEKQIALMEQFPGCHISFHPVLVEWVGSDLEKQVYKRHKNKNHLFPVETIIAKGGEFCPTVSLVFKRESREILWDWLAELPAVDYFTQISAAMNGGALYIDEPMAVYRSGVAGSWSKDHEEFLRMCEHSLRMMKAIRRFDRQTGFKFHRSFKKRENHILKKYSLFKVYNHDSETVDKALALTEKHVNGTLKLKCKLYLFLSFIYYKLKFKEVFRIKNQLKEMLG